MLTELPAELLWAVWAELQYNPGICNALIQTCRRLYNTFNDDFYDYYIHRHKRGARRPMLWAALNGREDCIGSLLAHGANPRIMDGATIEESAGHREHSLTCIGEEQILQERMRWKSTTPLSSAVRRGHLGVAKLLLDGGANVNAHTKAGRLPIIWAMESKQVEMLDLLINSGARIDFPLWGYDNLLTYAISHGWIGGIRALVAQRQEATGSVFHPKTSEFEDALVLAMLGGRKQAIDPFLEAMNSVNDQLCRKHTPLKIAVTEGFSGCINSILDHGGLVDHENHGESWSAIHTAVMRGDKKTTGILIDRGVSTDTRSLNGRTPLIAAVYEEDLGMVDLLLDRAAEPEARDSDGYTALLCAAMRGSPGMIHHLLPRADINVLDPHGYTALSIAIQGDNIRAVKALLKADKAAGQAQKGATADSSGNRLLIDKPDSRGRTPLFLATQYGAPDVVQLLLNYGSNAVYTPTCTGRTPLSFAETQRDKFKTSTVPILQSAVRDIETIIQLLRASSPADIKIGWKGPDQTQMAGFVAKCVICRVRISTYDPPATCKYCSVKEGFTAGKCFECCALKMLCRHEQG
ncbi:hypothetical protein ASPCAL02888 [Aspergillus calidoustus]|uniref:Uncharacterized protein n=1 Tax=Aspergillus calidoustus TaxID=454130 RepID=A0A0U5CNH9_ASPCI|nr:hypothetical protein ASPCAL02888 [Aspergillus calidoustus]